MLFIYWFFLIKKKSYVLPGVSKIYSSTSAALPSRLMKNGGQLSRFKQRKMSLNISLLRSTSLSGMIVAINKTQLRAEDMDTKLVGGPQGPSMRTLLYTCPGLHPAVKQMMSKRLFRPTASPSVFIFIAMPPLLFL